MMTKIEEYSVGQLAKLAGVSVRTLHHYDAIDLLNPAHVAANGYRLYGRAELLRLQEILFYRDIGMPLLEIKGLLEGATDAITRLSNHRDHLQAQAHKTTQMIDTLNATIAHLKGEHRMAAADLYEPFSQETQAAYEAWLVTTYGPAMADQIAITKQAVDKLPSGMEGAMEELRTIEKDLIAAYENSVDASSEQLHTGLERHRSFVTQMWGSPCSADGFEGLADLYCSHADFIARYERLSPQFSQWLPAAMRAHATRLRAAD